jgi:hypothetical protein
LLPCPTWLQVFIASKSSYEQLFFLALSFSTFASEIGVCGGHKSLVPGGQ